MKSLGVPYSNVTSALMKRGHLDVEMHKRETM